VAESSAITDLFERTPLRQLAESAIGAGRIPAMGRGHIALRFPSQADPPPPPQPHIDGTHSPNNGVPKGEVYCFTALAGVLLSDLPDPWCGNFTVWPGSHRTHEQYFRTHGEQALMDGVPALDLGAPCQITGRAGDIVLAHYLLAHAVAPHTGPNIRYATFFRIIADGFPGTESLCDAWGDWHGMRDVAESAKAR
jgi:hypothetical protein